MNIAALASELLQVVRKHAATLSPGEIANAVPILQKIFNFIISVITTGSGTLEYDATQTVDILGKSTALSEKLHVTAAPSGQSTQPAASA